MSGTDDPLNLDAGLGAGGSGGSGSGIGGSSVRPVTGGYNPYTNTINYQNNTGTPSSSSSYTPRNIFGGRSTLGNPNYNNSGYNNSNAGNQGAFNNQGQYANRDVPYRSSIFDGLNTSPSSTAGSYTPTSPNRIGANPTGSNPGNTSSPSPVNTGSPVSPAGGNPSNPNIPGMPFNTGTPSDNTSFSPSNFDTHFQDFADNFYSSPVEPPITPPYQGGQGLGVLYNVWYTLQVNFYPGFGDTNRPYTAKCWVQMYGQVTSIPSSTGLSGGTSWQAPLAFPMTRNEQGQLVLSFQQYSVLSAGGGLGGNNQVVALSIDRIERVDGQQMGNDELFPSSPGFDSQPNTNIDPLTFVGNNTDTSTDTSTNTNTSTNTQQSAVPSTSAPPNTTTTAPPETSPFNNPLNFPNSRPFDPFEPFELRDYPSSTPPTSNLTSTQTSTQTSSSTSGAPNGLRDPFSKEPINQPDLNKNPNEPNPSTTPSHDCDNPTDPCQAKTKRQLDRIEENSKKQDNPLIHGSIDNIKCSKFSDIDNSDSRFSYSGQGILGISEQLKALTKLQQEIKKDICRIEAIAGIPEVWLARYNTAVPQLVVLFAEVKDGKFQKSRYPITIPHYNGVKNPIFNPYNKGQYLGVLKLKDNTKLIINGKTASVVKNYITNLTKMIDKNFLPEITTVEPAKRANKTKEIQVYPVVARYYKKGVENAEPEWTKYYPLPK